MTIHICICIFVFPSFTRSARVWELSTIPSVTDAPCCCPVRFNWSGMLSALLARVNWRGRCSSRIFAWHTWIAHDIATRIFVFPTCTRTTSVWRIPRRIPRVTHAVSCKFAPYFRSRVTLTRRTSLVSIIILISACPAKSTNVVFVQKFPLGAGFHTCKHGEDKSDAEKSVNTHKQFRASISQMSLNIYTIFKFWQENMITNFPSFLVILSHWVSIPARAPHSPSFLQKNSRSVRLKCMTHVAHGSTPCIMLWSYFVSFHNLYWIFVNLKKWREAPNDMKNLTSAIMMQSQGFIF